MDLASSGENRNQMEYTLLRKRFKSCIKIAKTRRFHGTDLGSDNNLVLKTFNLHLKRTAKQSQIHDNHTRFIRKMYHRRTKYGPNFVLRYAMKISTNTDMHPIPRDDVELAVLN